MLGRFSKKPGNKKPDSIVPDDDTNQINSENTDDSENTESAFNTDHAESTKNVKSGNNEIPEKDAKIPETQESDLVETKEDLPEDQNNEMTILQAELSESQDKYLRLAAEFDNYRKRTLREKMELIQTAGESLLKDILPFVDDYERGIEATAKTDDMDAVKSGMNFIYNKLKEFLTSHGVKEISAMNEPFDAEWHDAVTNIPVSSDDMKGKIVDVIQKGYTLNNKIIRYPKVIVGE